jgi:hypothetical protein
MSTLEEVTAAAIKDLEQDIAECEYFICVLNDTERVNVLKTRLHLMSVRLADWKKNAN